MPDLETRPLLNASQAKKCDKITGAMMKVLFGICYVNLASNACFSVLASFFDKVSEEHGASSTEVGVIFGIFAGINVLGNVSSWLNRLNLLLSVAHIWLPCAGNWD